MSDTYEAVKAGAEAALQPLTNLIEKIAGPAAEELGLTFQDHVRVFRLQRQIRLLKKTDKLIERTGLEPRRVPLKLLGSILNNATLEEDDSLQDMWAALLANNATGKNAEVIFPEILRQLSPADAHLLRNCFREVMTPPVDRPGGFFSIKNSIEEWSSAQRMQGVKPVDYPLSPLSLENLARLGLISSSGILINGVGDANLTKIGFQFMYACEDPAVIKAAETELYKDPRVRRPTPAQPVKAGLPVGKKNG